MKIEITGGGLLKLAGVIGIIYFTYNVLLPLSIFFAFCMGWLK